MNKTEVLIVLILLSAALALAGFPSRPRPALVPSVAHLGCLEVATLPAGWRSRRGQLCYGLSIVVTLSNGLVTLFMH